MCEPLNLEEEEDESCLAVSIDRRPQVKRPDEKGKENLADKLVADAKLSEAIGQEVAQQGR